MHTEVERPNVRLNDRARDNRERERKRERERRGREGERGREREGGGGGRGRQQIHTVETSEGASTIRQLHKKLGVFRDISRPFSHSF